jgi:hypothetical protein
LSSLSRQAPPATSPPLILLRSECPRAINTAFQTTERPTNNPSTWSAGLIRLTRTCPRRPICRPWPWRSSSRLRTKKRTPAVWFNSARRHAGDRAQ